MHGPVRQPGAVPGDLVQAFFEVAIDVASVETIGVVADQQPPLVLEVAPHALDGVQL